MSRIIFKLTVARGGPGLFSNSLSHAGVREYFLIVLHAGVQEYFLIDCRTWVSRSVFKLTVLTSDTVETVDTVDTVEHC